MDVGAHQGYMTLLLSKCVGPSGAVFSFEPSEREFRRLQWNLAINRRRNVIVQRKGVSDTKEKGQLFVCLGPETGCNSLRPPDVPDETLLQEVQLTTLENEFSVAVGQKIDFLKIDVEGAELSVLRGADALLHGENAPIILCEVADIRTRPWGYGAGEIVEYLEDRNYQWFEIKSNGKLRTLSRSKTYHQNLVAIPTARAPQWQDLSTASES